MQLLRLLLREPQPRVGPLRLVLVPQQRCVNNHSFVSCECPCSSACYIGPLLAGGPPRDLQSRLRICHVLDGRGLRARPPECPADVDKGLLDLLPGLYLGLQQVGGFPDQAAELGHVAGELLVPLRMVHLLCELVQPRSKVAPVRAVQGLLRLARELAAEPALDDGLPHHVLNPDRHQHRLRGPHDDLHGHAHAQVGSGHALELLPAAPVDHAADVERRERCLLRLRLAQGRLGPRLQTLLRDQAMRRLPLVLPARGQRAGR
mmetsp:Transcript_76965/g.217773  ORF Transcript_76965/g.217773 Transcript_76965/m.217773 type:complete len:262 (-) Transcript_76965:22-807(-)